ncbi:MAG: SH3 domain-containing protein [Leptospirales bacterium]|nr:SH3 domain-containing protein [Leptospirales bacterium]
MHQNTSLISNHRFIFASFLSLCVVIQLAPVGVRASPASSTKYVSALTGLLVRTSPSQQAPPQDILNFSTKVSVIETRPPWMEIQGRVGNWVRVSYRKGKATEKEGWVFGGFLDDRIPELYYRVAAVSGLRLRKTPGVKGEPIDLLPYKTTGRVIAADPHHETIESRTGVWLEIKYKGRQGWIFSGFTMTNPSESGFAMLDQDRLRLTDGVLAPIDETEAQLLARGKVVSRKEVGGFRILEVSFGEVAPCDSPGGLFFIHKSTNRVYSSGHVGETMLPKETPLPNTIIASGGVCTCCCGGAATRLYMIEESQIRYATWLDTNKTAGCSWDMMFGLAPQIYHENRLSANGSRILMHRKQPRCDLPPNMDIDQAIRTGFSRSNVKDFDGESYLIIQKDGNSFKVQESGRIVPSEWDQAKPLP